LTAWAAFVLVAWLAQFIAFWPIICSVLNKFLGN
jgi:hypothetical protein